MNHEIYADHAATAPIEPLALEAMYTAYQEYANPAALYRSALHTKQTVEKARLTVAENLGCTPDHIFFTSGGSCHDVDDCLCWVFAVHTDSRDQCGAKSRLFHLCAAGVNFGVAIRSQLDFQLSVRVDFHAPTS